MSYIKPYLTLSVMRTRDTGDRTLVAAPDEISPKFYVVASEI